MARLKASEFVAGNMEHMQALSRMGIHLVTMSDGRVQLLHVSSQVSSCVDRCVSGALLNDIDTEMLHLVFYAHPGSENVAVQFHFDSNSCYS